MIRNLKALGMALLAVLAISAVAAQVASAQDLFTSDSVNGKTMLTGTSEGSSIFRSKSGGAGTICKHSIYTGTVAASAVSAITVHPEYPDAAALDCGFGSTTVTITTDGCDYVLTGTTDAAGDATFSIQCTAGSHIIKQIGHPTICTMTFGSQGPLKGVHYDNVTGAKKEVTITVTVNNLHFTKIAGNFCNLVPCTEHVPKTCTSGELEEKVLVKGYEHLGATQNGTTHKWSGVDETKQVNISVS